MSKVPCGGFELGDSLVVNDGKLDAKLGGLTVTFTMGDDGNIVSDKTFDEIFEAYKTGKQVSAVLVNGANDWSILHISVANDDEVQFFAIINTLESDLYTVVLVSRTGGNSLTSGVLTSRVP